jgi:anthranilate/para-aminobenzoate synthase component II
MATTRRAELEADKARLDILLVRAIKCGELKKSGVQFHPQSPYASVCADIVVVNPQ